MYIDPFKYMYFYCSLYTKHFYSSPINRCRSPIRQVENFSNVLLNNNKFLKRRLTYYTI